ncbi:hypothetical protein F5B17DRAFT_185083 [Nemania serpens]|nr:hypothetical protein F5B17DRAFT_185083 [Nemania serpens]
MRGRALPWLTSGMVSVLLPHRKLSFKFMPNSKARSSGRQISAGTAKLSEASSWVTFPYCRPRHGEIIDFSSFRFRELPRGLLSCLQCKYARCTTKYYKQRRRVRR